MFFDVVFVFTITQLAGVLEDDLTWAGFGRTLLILGVLWYAYTGYAWLTNHVPPRRPALKISLFAGMAGFLLTSVAVPTAFTDTRLLFAVGYLVLIIVHLITFSRSDARAVVPRLAPYDLAAALLILAAAFVGAPPPALWLAAALVQAALPYLTPRHSWIRVADTFHVSARHFVERHGLLVIIALGETVIAVGAGIDIHHVTAVTAGAIVMGLALPAAMWWTYFTDTRNADAALTTASPRARTHLAARTYVLPHYVILLGIIATAAGIHAAVPTRTSPPASPPRSRSPAASPCSSPASPAPGWACASAYPWPDQPAPSPCSPPCPSASGPSPVRRSPRPSACSP
ncbi:low temperature requirement protein A [Micromonospora sp. NBC_00898]|uniref:low temperature requirement protein A n=1 Tax=Micromonospora sp. NBC_00898 TaxID=2975981 RepID=UPI00386BFBA2|nr:low temperature requirement protein A [Micromonospora sp. NBC_00898]